MAEVNAILASVKVGSRILYGEKSSKVEQLLIDHLSEKPKIRTWKKVEIYNSYFVLYRQLMNPCTQDNLNFIQ
jgi:hypothetical protein